MDARKKILYPTDLSPGAASALPLVAALARGLEAKVLLLHVAAGGADGFAGQELQPAQQELLTTMRETAARTARDESREILRRHLPGIPVEVAVRTGDPSRTILDTARAEGVAMIVMATHGRGGWRRWLLGSVADRVVRQSAVPVVLVPMPAEE